MALPTLPMTDEEAADVVARFGGEAAYVEWLRQALNQRLEEIAVVSAREKVNASIRDSVVAEMSALPPVLAAPPELA